MDEATFRGPSPAANLVQVDARELAALRKVNAKAASFLARACDQQIKLPLDTAWMLGELCDAIHAVDEYDSD
jgi:hypothetical protein